MTKRTTAVPDALGFGSGDDARDIELQVRNGSTYRSIGDEPVVLGSGYTGRERDREDAIPLDRIFSADRHRRG